MKVTQSLKQKFPHAILGSSADYGDETVVVDRAAIIEVLQFLREYPASPFDLLLDICGVDFMGQTPRFEVVYHLYSLHTKARIRLKVKLDEADLHIPSCLSIWPAADWFEREAWDMYGIVFDGHPNLKRLMMWEEFEGYPLRKDYPLNKRQPIPKLADII